VEAFLQRHGAGDSHVFSKKDHAPRLTTRWSSGAVALGWYLSAFLLTIFGGGVVYATVVEVRHLTRVVPPAPEEVAQDVVVRNAGDDKGRRASFRIMLLTDDFRWRLSSTDAVERGTGGLAFSPEMKAALHDAKEIICVGASSEELPTGVKGERGRAAEERRAARRADQIAAWVKSAIGRDIPVRKLNVGYHAPTGETGNTSDQRRVVIILVLEREQNTNLDQALRAAMMAEASRSPIFDSLLTRYSLASAGGFSWVE
jgi:hypothetical protein